MHSRRIAIAATVLSLLLFAVQPATAMFMLGEPVPVERLLKNLDAYEKEHPKDAHAQYLRGRIHAYAYVYSTETLRQQEGGDATKPPILDENFPNGQDTNLKYAPLGENQLKEHLSKGIESYRKAIELDPKNAQYHLALAYLLNVARDKPGIVSQIQALAAQKVSDDDTKAAEAVIKKLGSDDNDERDNAEAALLKMGDKALPAVQKHLNDPDAEIAARSKKFVANLWREEAIGEYKQAWKLNIEADRKTDGFLKEPIAMEAVKAYVELTGERPLREGEKATVDEAKTDLKEFEARPRAVTPIIFSLEERQPLSGLVDPKKKVRFDIAGDDIQRNWEWIKQQTCILVWDPQHNGKIESGRQLFGNATWWMLFNNGFEALEALDDNRDGVLSGDELRGLAVWRDANGNGVSDKGEVVPIESTEIASIAVHAQSHVDASGTLAHATGLRLKDGRELPLYDWVSTGTPVKKTADR